MTDNIDQLLLGNSPSSNRVVVALVRARLTNDEFREALRGILENEDRRIDDKIVNNYLDETTVKGH